MIITGSMIKMNSSSESKKEHTVDEDLRITSGQNSITMDNHKVETQVKTMESKHQSENGVSSAKSFELPVENMKELTTNQSGRKAFWQDAAKSFVATTQANAPTPLMPDFSNLEDLKRRLIELMLTGKMGKKMDASLDGIKISNTRVTVTDMSAARIQVQAAEAQGQISVPIQGNIQSVNWGLRYNKVETYSESQSMDFEAEGAITTDDGRLIEIKFDMSLSREFVQRNEIHIQAGNANLVDPLMLSFNGTTPGLTEKKYDFDIDSDGKKEEVSFAAANAGFLALDKNENGTIDNGSELFGPETGSGFEELAQYDEDKNNWIDEKDSIFSKLIIWQKDPNGADVLSTLKQKNVGAIYLGNTATDFEFKDSENQVQGEVKQSGVFLSEDGQVGSAAQVDLAV